MSERGDETGTGPADASRLLLEFVRERDVNCPSCGYNIRNAARPQCPECRAPLALQVGDRRLAIWLLVVTIAPSIFSGIMACLFTFVMVFLTRAPPIGIIVLVAFWYASGLFGLALMAARDRFQHLPRSKKLTAAITTWTIHVIAFAIVLSASS